MASLKSLAKEIGVSVATISNAFNNKAKLSAPLRHRILKLAERHGYQPSPHARVLHGKRLRILGLMITSLHDGMAQGFFMGADRAAAEAGYSTILAVTSHLGVDTAEMEIQAARRFDSLRIGGALYLPAADTRHSRVEKLLNAAGIPFVLLYRRSSSDPSPAVLVDHAEGFRLGLEHLLLQGHRRIGLIDDPNYQGPELEIARSVFSQKCPKLSHKHWIAPFGTDDFQKLLKRNPTALFALSDTTAFQLADNLIARGYQLPGDISLIGFRDTIVARSMTPKLTTVHVPAEEIGYLAAQWLVKQIEQDSSTAKESPINLRIPPRLIVRQSTCPPRQ